MEDLFGKYEKMTDEELVEFSGSGDRDATECLLVRYKNLVLAKARMYFLVGADEKDIIQEGMIGLFKAIRDFDKSRQASFKGFAELCVKRQIITAVKTANRQKHMPLNTYVSLSNPMYEGDTEGILEEILSGSFDDDPERLFISKENAQFLTVKMDEVLSKLERSVLALYLEGKSYQEISAILDKPQKSIDNALQRVKKKMEKFSGM
ncbi:MAG: RNA polymerase sporulation sigma factor SigH [Clostridia bacterium]|nr:RNA polymerase sporulation sigma factor SigH [Oscillospiraceae bacterium]MBQ7960312.1 RNA polymerase sporulation sigma factor SigH [Clostridia bacterium]